MAVSLRNFRLLSRTVLQAAKTQNKTTSCRSFSRFSRQHKNASTFRTGAGLLVAAGASRALLGLGYRTTHVETLKEIDKMMSQAVEDWKGDKEMIFTSRQAFFQIIAHLEELKNKDAITQKEFNKRLAFIFTQFGEIDFYGRGQPLQAERFYKRAMILLKENGVKKTDEEMLSLIGNIGAICYTTERIEDGMKMLLFVKENSPDLAASFKETLDGFVETVPSISGDRLSELE